MTSLFRSVTWKDLTEMTSLRRANAGRERRTRHARTLAGRLLPISGSLEDLVSSAERHFGRRIRLLPFELDAESPSGLWIATDASDYIVFPARSSAEQRTAIVCHELSHMILRHGPQAGEDQLAALVSMAAPTLDAAVARRFLARHGYEDAAESDAETLGTYLAAGLARRAKEHAVFQDHVSARLR